MTTTTERKEEVMELTLSEIADAANSCITVAVKTSDAMAKHTASHYASNKDLLRLLREQRLRLQRAQELIEHLEANLEKPA